MNETPVTYVMFRQWDSDRDGHGTIALFPYEPWTPAGPLCLSYEHHGQHGSADAAGVIARTRPSRPEEYAALKAELEAEPFRYNLVVITRRDPNRYRPSDWTYKGVTVNPAGVSSSGIRWSALMNEAGGYVKSGTKAGMRELITHYLANPE